MATDETNYNNPYMRSPGLNDAGSYLVSGKPYYTGSAILTGEEVRLKSFLKQDLLLVPAASRYMHL